VPGFIQPWLCSSINNLINSATAQVVGVVQLEGVLVCELREVVTCLLTSDAAHLQTGRCQEILLAQAQLFAVSLASLG